jgi:ribosomal protein S19
MATQYMSVADVASRSVADVKAVIPTVSGVLMIITALVCLYFAVYLGSSFADPYGLLIMVGLGILAFALGLTAGTMSLLRRHFWLAVICGGLSLVPAFWVLLVGLSILSFKSMYIELIRFPIWVYLLVIALAPAIVGLVLVAASNKEFS